MQPRSVLGPYQIKISKYLWLKNFVNEKEISVPSSCVWLIDSNSNVWMRKLAEIVGVGKSVCLCTQVCTRLFMLLTGYSRSNFTVRGANVCFWHVCLNVLLCVCGSNEVFHHSFCLFVLWVQLTQDQLLDPRCRVLCMNEFHYYFFCQAVVIFFYDIGLFEPWLHTPDTPYWKGRIQVHKPIHLAASNSKTKQ